MYRWLPFLFLISCMSVDDTQKEKLFKKHEKKERISRFESERVYPEVVPEKEQPVQYPWE